ncbi:MAG: carboxypeptidase, partial [Gemmatimonadetes bacterium]|nr:carboxypeptidase [Gemmatimonadota bacterium]
AERFRFNDEELGGAGFAPWTAFDHPQLGKVEIGGWRTRFTTQNPPVQFLKGELELYVPWLLWLAEVGPRLEMEEVAATALGNTGLYRVRAVVRNVGYLPTNITQRAVEARLIEPVYATIELKDAEPVSGARRASLGHLPGLRDVGGQGPGETRRSIEYVVRRTGQRGAVVLTVASEKGGVVRREIPLR